MEETEQFFKSSNREINQNRIKQEINQINDVLDSSSIGDFEDSCYALSQKIAALSTSMMEDFAEIDMIEQAAMIRIRNYLSSYSRPHTIRPSLTSDRHNENSLGKNESLVIAFPQ